MTAPREKQSYANHRRLVPAFHFGVLPILVVGLAAAIARLKAAPGLDAAVAVAVAAALIVYTFQARVALLTAQDRIIRLEERLRLERLLPAELRPRIAELSARQLVALRFAGDAELPSLVRAVLDEGLERGDDIKRRIREWRADELRV